MAPSATNAMPLVLDADPHEVGAADLGDGGRDEQRDGTGDHAGIVPGRTGEPPRTPEPRRGQRRGADEHGDQEPAQRTHGAHAASGAKNISITGRASSGPGDLEHQLAVLAAEVEVEERAAGRLGGDELAGALLDVRGVAQAHPRAGIGRRAVDQAVGGERLYQREPGGQALGGQGAGDRQVGHRRSSG
jgi:hypothetical protein